MSKEDKLYQYINKRKRTLIKALEIDKAIKADPIDNWMKLKEISMVENILNDKKAGNPLSLII